MQRLDGHQRQIMTVAWSPNGDILATGSRDGTVRLWARDSGREIATLTAHPAGVERVEFSFRGNRLYTSGRDLTVRIWDPANGQLIGESVLGTVTETDWAECANVGRYIASGSFGGVLHLLDAQTGEILCAQRGRGRIWDLCSITDDQRLMISGSLGTGWGSDRGLVELWSVSHQRQSLTLADCEEMVPYVARHRSGLRLAGGSIDFSVYQWDAFPWKPESYGSENKARWPDQLQRHARTYWRNRLAAETAPGAVTRTNQLSFDRQRIPRRSEVATAAQLDLTGHYTGTLTDPLFPLDFIDAADNDLSELPAQMAEFGQVWFDVRGVIRTRSSHPSGHPFALTRDRYPARIAGIRVERPFTQLHLLHGCGGGWTDTVDGAKHAVPDGAPIARLVFHYADGGQHAESIVYGEHLLDWWGDPRDSREVGGGRVAWEGTNPVAHALGARLRLYHIALTNPSPERSVAHLDYESLLTACSHFVVAITVE
jgi:hypothetical protein